MHNKTNHASVASANIYVFSKQLNKLIFTHVTKMLINTENVLKINYLRVVSYQCWKIKWLKVQWKNVSKRMMKKMLMNIALSITKFEFINHFFNIIKILISIIWKDNVFSDLFFVGHLLQFPVHFHRIEVFVYSSHQLLYMWMCQKCLKCWSKWFTM